MQYIKKDIRYGKDSFLSHGWTQPTKNGDLAFWGISTTMEEN